MKRRTKIDNWFRQVLCAVFRHTPITTNCLGYQHCARCKGLQGDSLGGAYHVIVGLECGCETCQSTYKRLSWFDKFLVPKPKWLGYSPAEWILKCKAEREKWMKAVRAETARRQREYEALRAANG